MIKSAALFGGLSGLAVVDCKVQYRVYLSLYIGVNSVFMYVIVIDIQYLLRYQVECIVYCILCVCQ
jgi:hypothetical protein